MITDNDAAFTAAMLHDRRETIVATISRYIARPEQEMPSAEHMMAATALFDALTSSLSGNEPFFSSSPPDVDRQFITRFGDGLIPILKDTVGQDLPASLLSGLTDVYWRMINGRIEAAD